MSEDEMFESMGLQQEAETEDPQDAIEEPANEGESVAVEEVDEPQLSPDVERATKRWLD